MDDIATECASRSSDRHRLPGIEGEGIEGKPRGKTVEEQRGGRREVNACWREHDRGRWHNHVLSVCTTVWTGRDDEGNDAISDLEAVVSISAKLINHTRNIHAWYVRGWAFAEPSRLRTGTK